MAFIPLAEIRKPLPKRSFFVNYIEFAIGDPEITTMWVPASIFAGGPLASAVMRSGPAR